jgi:hypothetical protein
LFGIRCYFNKRPLAFRARGLRHSLERLLCPDNSQVANRFKVAGGSGLPASLAASLADDRSVRPDAARGLTATALRHSRLQQHTRHVYAFGTFIKDQSLFAQCRLDAHDLTIAALHRGHAILGFVAASERGALARRGLAVQGKDMCLHRAAAPPAIRAPRARGAGPRSRPRRQPPTRQRRAEVCRDRLRRG